LASKILAGLTQLAWSASRTDCACRVDRAVQQPSCH